MSSLHDLPDEVLLEIIRSLEAIRSYKTQSTAFRQKTTERNRQRENDVRKQALYSLCLSSHRLRRISLPTLYASSVTCATRIGLNQLQLFYNTISNPENALEQSRRLAEHITYIENRLAGYIGGSLYQDEHQEELALSYFHLLSKVVLCAPNIEHLSVVSLEHDEVSLWEHLLVGSPRTSIAGHGLSKIQYLSIQIHAYDWVAGLGAPKFQRIAPVLQSFTRLSELRISGAAAEYGDIPVLQLGVLSHLRRLDLTECSLELYGVSALILACTNLQRFKCKWANLSYADSAPLDLHDALVARADTLEALTLDMRDVEFYPDLNHELKFLGSLRPLRVLRSLKLCETGFLGSGVSLLESPSHIPDFTISSLFPEALEHLTLLIKGYTSLCNGNIIERTPCLRQLIQERESTLPHLDIIQIR